jgi:cytochrome c2
MMRSVPCRFIENLRRSLVLVLFIAIGAQTSWTEDESENTALKFSPEAAATFNKRCTACHTYGKGTKVGPDLKGVTERRKRDWLIKFIHASSVVIKSGDRTATDLFAQFKQQRMPDWTDLSEKQINDILDYVAIGGPDVKPADERSAELGTAADVENGRDLFSGRKSLKYGAQACAACHSVQGAVWGGSLGPDLSKTYFKHQDRALTEFLRHPCFQWSAGTPETHYLTAKESFSLKVFLRQAALQHRAKTETREERFHSAKSDGTSDHGVRTGLGNTQKGKAP